MSAGRANRRLYRPPEGSLIETDSHGKRRVVPWSEIKRQIADKAKLFWEKRPEGVRPTARMSMRERINQDARPKKVTPPAESR